MALVADAGPHNINVYERVRNLSALFGEGLRYLTAKKQQPWRTSIAAAPASGASSARDLPQPLKLPVTTLLPHAGLWFGAILITVMAWTLYDAATIASESSNWVARTYEVLETTSEIKAGINRAVSAQRGYLLSGSGAFLSERDQSLETVDNTVARVKKLTSDNPIQQRRIPQLEELIAARVAIMQETARLRRTKGFEIARSYAVSEVVHQADKRIGDLIAEMVQEEQRLLVSRQAHERYLNKHEQSIVVIVGLFSVIVLIPAYLGFIFQARARTRAERKLTDLTDSLPGALYQLRSCPNGSQRFEFLSRGIEKLRAVDREAAIGDFSVMWDTVLDEDKPAVLAIMAKALQTLAPTQYDFRARQPDGALKWLRASALLRKESDGSVLWNGYMADITEQRRLEDALKEAKEAADSANRAKSTFLATMSHEIRTPMNGVLGMIELLGLTRLDAEQRTTVEIVRESGKSLLRIIDDILEFSKIEAGRLTVSPEVASIKEVIEGVFNIYSGNASSKGLLLKPVVDPRISPAVWVDPVRLRQILNNFVSNAIKFTSKGTIEIEAQLIERVDAEDRVRFSVKDTGIGISAENQQQLFQPFSQAEADTTRRYGGTGLGLTICRRLAGLMGGSVEMVSELGKGTTMILTVLLPIADPKDLRKTEPPPLRDLLSTTTRMRRLTPSVAQAQTEGTLVLLVDDHPTNRLLLTRQITTLGYAVESAENGVNALEKWRSGRFGIVITDCNMPEMDGYELASTIRRLESANGGKRIPIIACTANALGGEAEICFAAGMDDYLAKPVELMQMLKKLDQWLPIPEAEAAPYEQSANRLNSSEPGAATPVERAVLSEISGGDAAVERDILLDFRRVNDEDTIMLKQAVASNDIPQVTRAAHRIKGACKMVGAMGLASVCEHIEHASRANDWNTIKVYMDAHHQEWRRLNAYLDLM